MLVHKSHSGQPVPKIDARIGKSRAALRAAMLDLMADHGFAEITAMMVVQRAGLGYSTFFRRYRDTHELLLDLVGEAVRELIALLLPAMSSGDHERAMRQLVDFIEGRRLFFEALLSGAGDTVRQELIERILSVVNSDKRLLPSPIPFELALTHMVGAVISTVSWWLGHAPATAPQDVADLLVRLAIRPALVR